MYINVKTKKGWTLFLSMILLSASAMCPIFALAETETKNDAFSSAGGRVSSANYETVLILGQSSPPGISQSTNFGEVGGFLAPFFIIQPAEGYDIAGRLGYYANDNPVADALVQTNSIYSDSTDAGGNYELLELPMDNYVVRPEKEFDTGSSISAYDAAWILQYGVGLRTFTPYQLIAGDVTGNGSVSAFDAARILQYGVSIINSFAVMPDSAHFWRFVPEDFPITL